MKHLLASFLAIVALAWAQQASAQSTAYVATVTFTNVALGTTNGDTVTVNGEIRTYTNDVSSSLSSLIASTNSIGWSATNTLIHFGTYALPGVDSVRASSTSSVEVTSILNSNLTVSLSSGVGEVSYVTNVYQDQAPLNLPLAVEPTASERTNMASLLIAEIGGNLPTNTIPQTAPALANFASLHQHQSLSNKTFHASTNSGGTVVAALLISGTVDSFTNGYWTNGILDGAILTNATIQGVLDGLTNGYWTNGILDGASLTNATIQGVLDGLTNGFIHNAVLMSPVMTNGTLHGFLGSVTNGLSTNLTALNLTVTNGFFHGVTITNANLVGTRAELEGTLPNMDFSCLAANETFAGSITFRKFDGSKAAPTNVESNDVLGIIAFAGYADTAAKTSGRIRFRADEDFTDTSSKGQLDIEITPDGATDTTVAAEIYAERFKINTELQVTGAITNSTFTGTNKFGKTGGPYAMVAMPFYSNSSLANGNNAGVDANGASVVQVSGPSAAFNLNGVAGGQDGYRLWIGNRTGFNMTVVNDSGVDPVAANRILTGTGADITITNQPGYVELIWNPTDQRWWVWGRSN